MTKFKDLKSYWDNQPQSKVPENGYKLVLEKIDFIKKKQCIANRVLIATILILIYFFISIQAYQNKYLILGLLLMIGALLVRIVIEYNSIKTLKKMDITKDATAFKADMTTYYKKRINTHYVTTPIILLFYWVGFSIMLPLFKENLSYGFFIYILISAIIVLIGMIFLIGKQIKNELKILKQMKN